MIDEQEFIHKFMPSRTGSPLTLLLLHGTGGTENDLLQLGREISPDASLLSPRGKVLENGMPRFFRRLAEGVFDMIDLTNRTHELASFLERSCRRYDLNPKQVVAIGYSNGANIAASTLILHPGLLAGAVLFRPMVPLIPNKPPNLSGTAVLILGGLWDLVVPKQQTETLSELLENSQCDVTLSWHDATHAITDEEIRVAREWTSSKFKF